MSNKQISHLKHTKIFLQKAIFVIGTPNIAYGVPTQNAIDCNLLWIYHIFPEATAISYPNAMWTARYVGKWKVAAPWVPEHQPTCQKGHESDGGDDKPKWLSHKMENTAQGVITS